MKKLAIAGASVALAAMPVVGVFAEGNDGTLSQTDTVVVTVESACSLTSNHEEDTPTPNKYAATITNGAANTSITGSALTITCNDTGGWDLNAIGAGTATGHNNYMDASTNVDDDDIVTADGTPTASSSAWAFKVAKSGTDSETAATITTGYTGFKAVPSSSTKIVTGTSTKGNVTITATYGVSIDDTQSAGTYTGKVQYTLVHPAATTPTEG